MTKKSGKNVKSSDEYLNIYIRAMNSRREIDCYNNKIVFRDRDSMTPALTDMKIVWENCIIPLYQMGDSDIPDRVKNIVRELLTSGHVVSIYNACKCISAYQWLGLVFHRIPFEIDFTDIFPLVKEAVLRNADKIKNYQGREFNGLPSSPWEIIAPMAGLDAEPKMRQLNKPIPKKR